MTSDMKTKFIAMIVTVGLIISTGIAQTTDTLTATPNPFPVSTDLTIQNLNSDTVTLKIYDQWGSLLVTFFENLVLSGTVTVTFNADTLPGDMYIASLIINSKFIGLKLVKDQSVTALTDPKIDLGTIQVYPNPTVDLLTISTNLQITGLTIYDLHGRELLQSKSGQQNTVDLKNFDSGIYLLLLRTNDMTYIKRVIKK